MRARVVDSRTVAARSWDSFNRWREHITQRSVELQPLEKRVARLAQEGAHLCSITSFLLAKGQTLQERSRKLREELAEHGAKSRRAVRDSREKRGEMAGSGSTPSDVIAT